MFLLLNIEKTNFIVIGKNRHIENIEIYLDGHRVQQQLHVKFLGIIVDEKLDWGAHVYHCRLKIMSSLFALRNTRNCVNIQTCKLLYYTLIYPYLSRGLHLSGSTFKAYLNPLIVLQTRAVRIIAGVGCLDHTMPLFKDLHILPIVNLLLC